MKRLLFIPFLCLMLSASRVTAQTDKTLTIQKANGEEISVQIEIADSPEKQRTGLMFRKYMPENAGMLFLFDRSERIGMWMKNTYLPLDMLFIDENGLIQDIAENTEPLSLKTIESKTDVSAVLETNAGFVKKNKINTGDKVIHSFFKK